MFKFLVFISILFCSFRLFAQEPVISYGENQFFDLDSARTLSPIQSGGKVPRKRYGQTSTFAGKTEAGYVNGKIRDAKFNFPSAIAIDKSGNMFIADEKNNSIRKISTNGTVSTLADKGFNGPSGIVVDAAGNVLVADCNHHQIKKIFPNGKVIVVAGSGKPGNEDNSNGLLATFKYPVALALDRQGNIYVSDEGNNKIRKVSINGAVKTFAGSGVVGMVDHANGKLAKFNQPNGVAIDSAGNVYVADQLNQKIRLITPTGSVSSFAGTGMAGTINSDIPLMASFNNPRGIAIDEVGNLYISDVANQEIRKISRFGAVTTLAGNGVAGDLDNLKGQLASFYFPNGMAINREGELFITDGLNNKIRKVETTGYAITPDVLPIGLAFDAATGIFSGIPKQFSPGAKFHVTAYNTFGNNSTDLEISISGQPGNALNLDGFDDQLVIPDHPSLTPKTVTVEMWINPQAISSFARFIVKRNAKRRYDDSYSLGIDSLGYYRAVMASGTGLKGSQAIALSKKKLIIGQWSFLSGVFTKDSVSLYVDGILQEKVPSGFPISTGENELAFGFDKNIPYSVDEVRIFSTDRSSVMMADMQNTISSSDTTLVAYYNFNSGRPSAQNSAYTKLYDQSFNANHGRLNNFSTFGNKSNWIESYAMVIPSDVIATEISNVGFTAKWSPSKFGRATAYLIDVSEDPLFESFLNGYNGRILTETNLRITGLKSGKTFYFRVCAFKNTVLGKGAFSPVIQVKIP